MDIPISRLTKRMTVTVNLTGVTAWKARVWLGTQIVKLAARVMGCGFRVDFEVDRHG